MASVGSVKRSSNTPHRVNDENIYGWNIEYGNVEHDIDDGDSDITDVHGKDEVYATGFEFEEVINEGKKTQYLKGEANTDVN